ncbi:MAG TPA: MHYT domain-containing protein [Burkholderiales bacterium]|nr:MHYT domain-containing protein [Burkholderiales bacterium]
MNTIHYEPFLVALSYVISVFGSYTALQLAIAIPAGRTWGAVMGSVIGAAAAVGGGAIWSMHFIGMNAADLGIPVAYDPVLTITSLILSILAPAVGLFIVGRSDGGPINLPLGGVLTGLGVALMHYTGMAAMIMPAKISYDPTLFWASIAIAIVAATVALWLAFNLRGNLQRFGSAFVMGIAVCGMHYTGMYALKLEPTKEAVVNTGIALSPTNLAYSVFGVTAVILTLLLIYSAWKSQRALSANL